MAIFFQIYGFLSTKLKYRNWKKLLFITYDDNGYFKSLTIVQLSCKLEN